MRNFISFLTIILCCLTVTPMHGRKKDKQADKEEVVLAMVEPDMMATPSHSHPVVAPVEEAYRHRINKNEHRYGIDVSRYQGDIDWQTVKTDKKCKLRLPESYRRRLSGRCDLSLQPDRGA